MVTLLTLEERKKIGDEISLRAQETCSNKCALWCANIYRDCLGYDPGRGFRQYRNDRERVAEIGSQMDVARAVLATVRELGWIPVNPSNAVTGDFGIVSTPKGIISVIKDKYGSWVTKTDDGFMTFPNEYIARAFMVTANGH